MTEPILKGVDLGYNADSKQILAGLNFEIYPKELITLTGPSGGGKSTLLRLLASLLSKTSGHLTLMGKEIDDYDPIMYRREVSYAFQQPQLFGHTVADNLKFPFDIREQRFDEAKAMHCLEMVNLTAEHLRQPINGLSGGERQRVALLRNIMFMPKILLLDEITTGLDEENKAIINKLVKRLNKESGLTIISITHDKEEFELADRLITLKDGKLEG